MATELSAEEIREAAIRSKSMSVDGQSLTERGIDELIKAAEWAKETDAVSSTKLPIRLMKLRPSGTT